MSTCSICLSEVRQTRNNVPIRCGHLFHNTCIDKWKQKGHKTCPMCRKIFDASNFNVVISIRNNYESTSNALSLTSEEAVFNVLDIFDLTFDVDNVLDLNDILDDIGVTLTDFDSSILNAE